MVETYWEKNTRRQNPCKICENDHGPVLEQEIKNPLSQEDKERHAQISQKAIDEGRYGRGCRHCLCDQFEKDKHGEKNWGKRLFSEAGLEMPSKCCGSCLDGISRENLKLHVNAGFCHCRTEDEIEEMREKYRNEHGNDPPSEV